MIKTKRLELVGFDVKYTNDLLELWSDFEVIKYTYTPLISTFDDCINYIKHQIDRTDKNFTDHEWAEAEVLACGTWCTRSSWSHDSRNQRELGENLWFLPH